MPRKPRWTTIDYKDGVLVVELSSWKYFHDYVHQKMLPYYYYVWRGQRDAAWGLQTSLDRALRFQPKAVHAAVARRHLENFKLAARGRRGSNPSPIKEENEWWALAQHNGMATPLLDWTASPFVALYFAFERDEAPPAGLRAVWALGGFESKDDEITQAHTDETRPPILELVRPMQDENARLVNQSGLFTRVPIGKTVETWVQANYKGDPDAAVLLKLLLPNTGRPECLRTLNKMNINHLSLFPDLFGAGEHCNKTLAIDGY